MLEKRLFLAAFLVFFVGAAMAQDPDRNDDESFCTMSGCIDSVNVDLTAVRLPEGTYVLSVTGDKAISCSITIPFLKQSDDCVKRGLHVMAEEKPAPVKCGKDDCSAGIARTGQLGGFSLEGTPQKVEVKIQNSNGATAFSQILTPEYTDYSPNDPQCETKPCKTANVKAEAQKP
jgi:hypothetical protein